MTVYINHDRFSTTLYDKRDSFSFDIVNFPHMNSNIPSKPAYGVYISQLIRIGRICEDFSAFAERHYKLTSRLIKQRFWYNKVCVAFKRFSQNHSDIFSKYKVSLREHIRGRRQLLRSGGTHEMRSLAAHDSALRSRGVWGHAEFFGFFWVPEIVSDAISVV